MGISVITPQKKKMSRHLSAKAMQSWHAFKQCKLSAELIELQNAAPGEADRQLPMVLANCS